MRMIALSLLAFVSAAHAQDQQPQCRNSTIYGMICAPPGGMMMTGMFGDAVCGRGYCIKDMGGDIVCSRQPGGYATKDMFGSVACVGGCERPSSIYCVPVR